MSRYALVSMLCLLVAGCGPTVIGPDSSKPVVVNIDKDPGEYFSAIADTIGQTTRDTFKLSQMVEIGRRDKWLTDADVTRFDEKFPNASSKQREVTSADAAKLRELAK